MWLLIEDGRLLNLSLITDIIPDERAERATAWCSGVPIYSHSRVLYTYYLDQRAALLRPAKPEDQPPAPLAVPDVPPAPVGE